MLFCGWFQSTIAIFFQDVARAIAKWPLPFLVIPLLICGSLSYGIYLRRDKFKKFDDEGQVTQFLPDNLEALKQLQKLQEFFPSSNPIRDTYMLNGGRGHVTMVSENGSNILTEKTLRFAVELVEAIKAMPVNFSESENVTWNLICYPIDIRGTCLLNHPIFSPNSQKRLSTLRNLTYPDYRFSGAVFNNALYFGGVQLQQTRNSNSRSGVILSAKALRLPYALNVETPELKYIAYMWEKQLLKLLPRIRLDGIEISWLTGVSWSEEISRNGKMTIPYFPVLVCSLLVFSVFACLSSDWVLSKPCIGFCGIISATLAIASAFGTLFYFDVPFIRLVLICPFLILSISVDNTFLLLNSWRMTNPLSAVEERMATAAGSSAVSVTVTALTDGLSLSVGCFSQFPAIRIFCSYCALAILFSYLYQLTFFIACMALSARREAANRHCIALIKVKPKWDLRHGTGCYSMFCAGGYSGTSPRNQTLAHRYTENRLSSFFGTYYASWLQHWSVRIGIIILYLVYLAASIWGILNLKLGLKVENLVPDRSYMKKDLAASDQYFTNFNDVAFVVFDKPIPYHNADASRYLKSAMADLFNTPFTALGEFWLPEFERFSASQDSNRSSFLRRKTQLKFASQMKEFLEQPEYAQFSSDISFRDGKFVASKAIIKLYNASSDNFNQIANLLRDKFQESRIPGFIFAKSFLLIDQEQSTLINTLQNITLAIGIVLVVSSAFVTNALGGFLCGLSIISINLGVVGFLSIWNVRLDVISMVTLVMSIGFSADFAIHIIYYYASPKCAGIWTPTRKRPTQLHYAMQRVGLPVLQSALSTLLGVASLALIESYVIRVFVKTVVLVILIGLAHSLLFLPIVLSLSVPNPVDKEENCENQYGRIRSYLTMKIPRYLEQVTNRRMAAYQTKINADAEFSSPAKNHFCCSCEAAMQCPCRRRNMQISTENTTRVLQPTRAMARKPIIQRRPPSFVGTLRRVADLYGFLRAKSQDEPSTPARVVKPRRPPLINVISSSDDGSPAFTELNFEFSEESSAPTSTRDLIPTNVQAMHVEALESQPNGFKSGNRYHRQRHRSKVLDDLIEVDDPNACTCDDSPVKLTQEMPEMDTFEPLNLDIPPSIAPNSETVQIILKGKCGSRLDLQKSVSALYSSKSHGSVADSDQFGIFFPDTNSQKTDEPTKVRRQRRKRPEKFSTFQKGNDNPTFSDSESS